MSEALYRKYRPQIFEDVVGQEHIERTIKNAIEQDKVSHAYLFTGPRGTGKTTTARLLAKALLCEHGPTPEPDGTCEDCVMIAAGEHPDVYELDAASRTGVENVREEIIGRVQFAPTRGRYKIYIIDEVHMLSTAAFNALLKTLEEPPSHVVFILATTDPQKVPETIHSRCQRFDFRRISQEALVSRLGAVCVSEGVEFEGEALDLVAHRAEGGMRNALTSLEQLIAFGEGKVTLEVAERMLGGVDANDLAGIVRAIGTRDVAACFRWTAEFVETGADLAQFTRDLAEHVRNLYVLSLAGSDVPLEVSDAVRRELAHEMQWFGPDRLSRLLGVLGDLSAELKTSTNPRLSFEIALTRMVRPDSDLTLEALAERVEALESGYSAVAHVSSVPASVPGSMPAGGPVGMPGGGAAGAPTSPAVPTEGPSSGSTATGRADGEAPAPAQDGVAAPLAARTHAEQAGSASQVVPTSVAATPRPASQDEARPPACEAASAPASVTTASAAAEGGALSSTLAASFQNPASLQRIWQATLSALKKSKAAYGVLFLNTKAVYDASKGLLRIDFPAENAFAFKAVQKPEVREAVGQALAQACGEAVPFSYAQGGAVSVPATAPSAPEPVRTPVAADASTSPAVGAGQRLPASDGASGRSPSQRQNAGLAEGAATGAKASSSVPAPMAPPVPDPAPTVPAPAPPYDVVPYDDEVVPYDDYLPPEAEADAVAPSLPETPRGSMPSVPASTASVGAATDRSSSSADASPSPDMPTPSSGSAFAVPPAAPDARTSATPAVSSGSQTPDDLQAVLEAGFGQGVVVEEVRE
ncbi:DNA polymerase III subunit gamma/tau [Gordonibacter sp. An230]|uniref:DNA polymerase III subunit gamma/tau n=1 Tax=Gordonibacter sp. An230 TaxID=1965592 RepID=UPI000B365276|nr:DNA polymerase III subunit gamma/tau [Gordonibacter sp. An230]OUO92001.1 DNA polymerase III subunit gamma/tau [Gordonibacter sp. An230]